MTTDSTTLTTTPAHAADVSSTTRRRVTLLCGLLVVAAVASLLGGLFWPSPSGGGQTYEYADLASIRVRWWLVLNGLAVSVILGVSAQAIAVLILVRRRGAAWAEWGAGLVFLGVAMQAVGVGGMAAAYFFPTDASVGAAGGSSVFDAINDDQGHLFGIMIAGAALALVGEVLQAVALFRSRAVPRWVPVLALFIIVTIFVLGGGLVGLIPELPICLAAISIAYFAYRTVTPPQPR